MNTLSVILLILTRNLSSELVIICPHNLSSYTAGINVLVVPVFYSKLSISGQAWYPHELSTALACVMTQEWDLA